jgi:hypothetical protein
VAMPPPQRRHSERFKPDPYTNPSPVALPFMAVFTQPACSELECVGGFQRLAKWMEHADTPGSTRAPTPKTVIARRETEPHPRRQGGALPKTPPVVGEDVSVLSCSASERLRPVSPWFPTWETPPSRVPLIPGPKVRKKGCEPTVSTAGSPPHRPALAEDLSTLPCSVPEGLGFS